MIVGSILIFASILSTQAIQMTNDTYVITHRSGIIHPNIRPVLVRPGDNILICGPPGISIGCHSFHNGTCWKMNHGCVVKHIHPKLKRHSSLILSTSLPYLLENHLQPGIDPIPHCFLLSRRNRNAKFMEACIKSFDSYKNVTSTHIGMSPKHLRLSAQVQIVDDTELDTHRSLIVFLGQVVLVLLTVPLLLLKWDY